MSLSVPPSLSNPQIAVLNAQKSAPAKAPPMVRRDARIADTLRERSLANPEAYNEPETTWVETFAAWVKGKWDAFKARRRPINVPAID